MKDLLADADFRRAWLVGTIASGVRWLELLAVGVYVLEVTGSASMVALITLLRLAPMFVCGSLIGALRDRYQRQLVLLISLAIAGVTALLLGLLALTDRITLWQIALGTVVSGAYNAGDVSLRRILTAELAGHDRLSRAMALEGINSNGTRMLGPALGGFLLEFLGLYCVYLLAALLYLVAIVLIVRIRHRSADSGNAQGGVLRTLRDGWRYVRAQRVIVGVLAITAVANFWGFAYIAMVPAIGDRVLHLSAFPIGVLVSIQGLGAMVGALAVPRIPRSETYTRVFFASTLLFLLGVLGFGLSRWFPLSLGLNLLCGLGIGCFSVLQSSILILAARPEVRSRVMGLLTVCIGASQLGGMAHVGLLADGLGAAAAVQLMALEGLVVLALCALIWPETRRMTVLVQSPADADD
jgi:MFS family permease